MRNKLNSVLMFVKKKIEEHFIMLTNRSNVYSTCHQFLLQKKNEQQLLDLTYRYIGKKKELHNDQSAVRS